MVVLAGCSRSSKPSSPGNVSDTTSELKSVEIGFYIIPQQEDLLNCDVPFRGDGIGFVLKMDLSADGKLAGRQEDNDPYYNRIISEAEGTFDGQRLVLSGTWDVETQTNMSHTNGYHKGDFRIEGEYANNALTLDAEKTSATGQSEWRLERSDGISTGEYTYQELEIQLVYFRVK